MDRFEPNLRIPGPTALPPSVREAGGRQMINHRGPEFAAMLERILDRDDAVLRDDERHRDDLDRRLGRARGGGRQHAVARRPRPRASASARSATGSRRSPASTAPTSPSSTPSGATPPPPTRSASACARCPTVKAVLLTHNETSTGVMNPIPELAAAIRDERPDALILVDSVSGLGAVPFEMDAWGVDVVVTGSQKAWMAAPGLAMIAASPRAWAAMETATMPRFYLDLRAHRDAAAKGETPLTPAIAVVYQVDEGLRLMQDEGADGDLRPPRGVRRGRAGRPRGAWASSSSPTRATPRGR